jgi:hypothetical protein
MDRLNGVSAKGAWAVARLLVGLDAAAGAGKPMNIAFDSGRKGPGYGRPPPTGPRSGRLINRIGSAPLIDRVAK